MGHFELTLSGVIVTVGGTVGELEELAHPQADLGGDAR